MASEGHKEPRMKVGWKVACTGIVALYLAFGFIYIVAPSGSSLELIGHVGVYALVGITVLGLGLSMIWEMP